MPTAFAPGLAEADVEVRGTDIIREAGDTDVKDIFALNFIDEDLQALDRPERQAGVFKIESYGIITLNNPSPPLNDILRNSILRRFKGWQLNDRRRRRYRFSSHEQVDPVRGQVIPVWNTKIAGIGQVVGGGQP